MQKIPTYELELNPFKTIHHQWAMVTTRAGEKTNTMTASWGGIGVLWNKPVVHVYLRPQRFTRELLDGSELFSVCFLPEEYRPQLNYCGAHSGREEDKLAACGFTAGELDGAPILAQAELILTCKKIYRQQFTSDSFLDPTLNGLHYPKDDQHFAYIGEILGVYRNESV